MQTVRADRSPLVTPGGYEHHVGDMTATFSADMTLAGVDEILARTGQWLPIDGVRSRTLRELVQSNSTGPLRLGFGAWRDLLLGAQFINGRGDLITAGGRTVKNVAGYDLTKFMVGQGGVFGRLVTITTRTYKRPVAAAVARFAPDTKLVNRLIPTDLRPQWMLLTADGLSCGYVGDQRTVDYCVANLPRVEPNAVERRTIEQDIAEREQLWQARGETTYRTAVPPGRVIEFVKEVPAGWVADPAFGIVIGACEPGSFAPIRSAATRMSGTVTFFSAAGMNFEPRSDAERRLLERLKQSFDPDGKLVPLPWKT